MSDNDQLLDHSDSQLRCSCSIVLAGSSAEQQPTLGYARAVTVVSSLNVTANTSKFGQFDRLILKAASVRIT